MPAAEAIRWYDENVTVRYWSDDREEVVTHTAANSLMSRGLAYIVQPAAPEEPVDGAEKELEEIEDLIGTVAPQQEVPKAPQPKSAVSTRKGASVKNESQPDTE